MLKTLVRLTGIWLAIHGLSYAPQFLWIWDRATTPQENLLLVFPLLTALLLGVVFFFFAPLIAGKEPDHVGAPPPVDILPAGLVLLGVFWTGTGAFLAIGNLPFYADAFDWATGAYAMNKYAYWQAGGHALKLAAGIVLIVVGNRLRARAL